jgi:DNA-binding NtrC family response regulator/PAS domain-containing protein
MRKSSQAEGSHSVVTKLGGWAKQAVDKTPRLDRLNIGPRLTLCFAFIILAMLVGDAVLRWQFHVVQGQTERLRGVDQELILVLQAHTNLMSFYERLDALAHSEDTARLAREAEPLRTALLEDSRRTQNALSRLPAEVQLDPTLLPTLEAIQAALPAQLEAITLLATSADWEAVRLRLAIQVRQLELSMSALVKNIDREVGEQRAQAVLNIEQAQRRIFLILPITAMVTLLFAAFLGLAVTRSITQPLGRLMEASKALGRGEFHRRVSVIGRDELAHLGRVFNDTAGTLRDLYGTLYSREAYLAEAQRLSHTGSFGWNISNGELVWSDETFRIFQYSPRDKPTVEMVLQRTHPEDVAVVQQLIDRPSRGGADWDLEYRLLMPDGSVKYVRLVGHPSENESGSFEFVGAVTDITDRKRAEADLQKALDEIQKLRDQLYKENIALREEVDKASMFEDIVGESPALQAVLARVAKVAPTDSTVLITGETGTGKELIARAIHKRSQRSARAFVSVNCAATPAALIASELFGHEKGAFTGALQRRLGRFELAEGGTIFLDEIGELPAETQIALLRVLQEREFERVGGSQPIPADVRVIAATNRNLESAIAGGAFRSDLFYRLNVFPIEMPPLRERKEDIPILIEYFIHRYSRKAGKKIKGIEKRTLNLLESYAWPGNIRELQNILERSVILCETSLFSVDPSWLSFETSSSQPGSGPTAKMSAQEERETIERALAATGGRISGPSGAAAQLSMPPSTLESKIRSMKINKFRFKKV